MNNKDEIVGVLSYPYPNKYVVTVTRTCGRLSPVTRTYSAFYTDKHKVRLLVKRFLNLNDLLQYRMVDKLLSSVK